MTDIQTPTSAPQASGPVVDLIEHAASIIVAKREEAHTAPYHWAGALWEAGMLQPPGHRTDLHIVTPSGGVSPTPDAYRAAREALDKHRARADEAETALRQMGNLFGLVRRSTTWLNDTNGRSEAEVLLRILKVTEEAGEVAQAVIGHAGQNPRKGRTHGVDDVARELVDVAVTALVAVQSLGYWDVAEVVGESVARVSARLDEMGVAP